MTRLLQEAVSAVAARLEPPEQDRLARLMMQNLNRLRHVLEEEAEEQVFEAAAVDAIESEAVQDLLAQAAKKHAS